MQVAHAGLVAAAVLALGATAAAAPAPRPMAPPRLLNIVRVKVKAHSVDPYATLEAQIVRAYERAKVKLYWVCLRSSTDPTDVLYVNLYDSPEAADRATVAYQESVSKHPELVALQDKLSAMTASSASTLTTRRDDVDRAVEDVDFGSMRQLRMTVVDVRPGREGDFLDAIRTAPVREGSWLVYEANQSSTYALIRLKRKAFTRRDGPAIPRSVRRSKDVTLKTEAHVYAVRPDMSHVSPEFIAANPRLWRQATTVGTGGAR